MKMAMSNKSLTPSLLQTAVLSFAVALFACFVVPLQTYLSSKDLFPFSMGEFFLQSLFMALICGGALFGIIGCFSKWLGNLATALLLALMVCLYFETSILSIGLPPINGVGGFHSVSRIIVDSIVWGLIALIFIVARNIINSKAIWIALVVMIMSGASLVDSMKGEGVSAETPLSAGFATRHDIVMNATLSTNRNVIVFILDMTPGTLAADIMEASPELRKKFEGFVAFKNNLCMHEYTTLGLPGLMTGEYQSDAMGFEEYQMSIFGTNSFLYPYVKSDAAVFYSGGLQKFGYTNRLKDRYSERYDTEDDWNVFRRRTLELPNIRMLDAMCIRMAPYFFKQWFFDRGLKAVNRVTSALPSGEDEFVFRRLEGANLSADLLSLGVFHTHGLHWPIKFDRHGNLLDKPLTAEDEHGGDMQVYRKAMFEVGYHVLDILGDLMDSLRQRGVYDCSTVIVAADHGCVIMREGENNGSESSILWVKPEMGHGAFCFRSDPTSNCKVKDLVCALHDKKLGIDEMARILSVKGRRLFRAEFNRKRSRYLGGKLHWTDWLYDEDGNLVEIVRE